MKGKLITFEGIECCGKGTQAKLLLDYLLGQEIKVRLLREPGGTDIGEAIRAILKFPNTAMGALFRAFGSHSDFPNARQLAFKAMTRAQELDISPACELFLFEAARAEYAKAIKPILEAGEHAISDRLMDSTTAYQGGGSGLATADIYAMNRIAMGGIWPDITFLLDLPVDVMLERVQRQDKEKNARHENTCDGAFFERVRQAYLDIAKREPDRVVVIDADQPVHTIAEQIRAEVDDLLKIEQ